MSFKKFIDSLNKKKITFCPGPGSITEENILGLRNSFGRNDPDYEKVEKFVLNKLKKITGQKNIVSFQGSGTLAIEMMMLNFLQGRVLVVSTGYYSERIFNILFNLQKIHKIYKSLEKIKWEAIYNNQNKKNYDWVIACPTETSKALLIPIKDLSEFAKKKNAKLMLDATGSIGLEENHNLASVISFSSCKGIFGFTGAAFIAYNCLKVKFRRLSFYQDLDTHLNKKVTGAYTAILSLYFVMKNFNKLKKSVLINKKKFLLNMKDYLIYPNKHQPNLCTFVKLNIKKDKNLILYKPRIKLNGTIISHLGELWLGSKAKGKIFSKLKFI